MALDLPDDSLHQVFLDKHDGGLCHLPSQVVDILAYVRSKIETAHAVAMLPGKVSVEQVTAPLPDLLKQCYYVFDVATTESLLVLLLLLNRGQNQQTISWKFPWQCSSEDLRASGDHQTLLPRTCHLRGILSARAPCLAPRQRPVPDKTSSPAATSSRLRRGLCGHSTVGTAVY